MRSHQCAGGPRVRRTPQRPQCVARLPGARGGGTGGGGVALSDGNKRITFTPQTALSPSTTYTVSATAQITDVSALALQNPSNSTFTTGTTSDTTQAQVVTMNPVQNSSGAPTNTVLTLQFNKPINPLTVTSTTFGLFSDNGQIPVLGAIAVSADGRTATFTANPPLLRDTYYLVLATNGITDIEGQTLSYFQTSFTTGSGAATMAPTVSLVSPQNGSMGVPVNARVDVVMSSPINPATVGSSAITVTAGATPVAGAIAVSSDRTTLTFTPSSLLAVSTTYTVAVSGFTDQAGNSVTFSPATLRPVLPAWPTLLRHQSRV